MRPLRFDTTWRQALSSVVLSFSTVAIGVAIGYGFNSYTISSHLPRILFPLYGTVMLVLIVVALPFVLLLALLEGIGLGPMLISAGIPSGRELLWPFRLAPWLYCAVFYSVAVFLTVRFWQGRCRRTNPARARLVKPIRE